MAVHRRYFVHAHIVLWRYAVRGRGRSKSICTRFWLDSILSSDLLDIVHRQLDRIYLKRLLDVVHREGRCSVVLSIILALWWQCADTIKQGPGGRSTVEDWSGWMELYKKACLWKSLLTCLFDMHIFALLHTNDHQKVFFLPFTKISSLVI